MKEIRIFNAQPFFLMFISWILIMPSFKKSLIAERCQGSYLKWKSKSVCTSLHQLSRFSVRKSNSATQVLLLTLYTLSLISARNNRNQQLQWRFSSVNFISMLLQMLFFTVAILFFTIAEGVLAYWLVESYGLWDYRPWKWRNMCAVPVVLFLVFRKNKCSCKKQIDHNFPCSTLL